MAALAAGIAVTPFPSTCRHLTLCSLPLQPDASYQTPLLYGSQEEVPASNFFPVNLANFGFQPGNSTTYPVPAGWSGQMSIILMLKDGIKGSRVQCYFRQASDNVEAVPNVATAG